jgi:hypothetical protein
MRLLRICGYWSLLLLLLGTSSCTRKLATLPRGCDASAKTCIVTIVLNNDSCVAQPDQQDVVLGYTVTWKAPDTTYSARFLRTKTPFQTSTGKVTVVPAGPPSKPVTGDNSCGTTPNPPPAATNASCYFAYDVYHGDTACGDPGIHVVN